MQSYNMSLSKVSERARRRRATLNLSRALGCYRSTYNRRWNKLRTDFLRKHNLLSFSDFVNENTITVDRESNCHEIPSTGIPSTSFTNGRLLEDNGCYNVNLCSHKSVNRKEQINKILMTLMTTKSLSIRDADRILNDFRVFLPDLPASIRSYLRTCTTKVLQRCCLQTLRIEDQSPDNKKYVIIDAPSKKQLVIAAEHWVVGEKLCLYPTEQTDMHLQNNDPPNDNWSVLKCKVVHKCDSLQSANDLLVSFKNSDVYHTNCLSDENTLPLNSEEQKKDALKHKEGFLYNSVDKDVAEMQAGNIHVQYPKLRMFDRVVSPIANSTQLDISPSTSESRSVDSALVADELNTNAGQLLSQFAERKHLRQFDCGLLGQQFPLSSEEELGTLDAYLEQKDVRDRFMAMLTC